MNCSFRAKREVPFEIPPGATEVVDCTAYVHGAGDFTSQLHVYYDDVGLREIVLTVWGDAQAADR